MAITPKYDRLLGTVRESDSVSIGSTITGGAAKEVLYIDSASKIAGDLNLIWDSTTGKLTVGKVIATGGGAAPNTSLYVNGAIESYGTLDENNNSLHFGMGIGPGGDSARILFGHPAQNWEIDNVGGYFRWFTPGIEEIRLYSVVAGNTLDLVSGRTLTGVGNFNLTGIITQSSAATVNTFTSQIKTPASTTTRTGLTLPAGTAPTTPVSGDVWNDTTQKTIQISEAGIKQSLVGCIFTQTADATVTNTVTETSIIGTGVGTLTLPANFFVAGKTVRLRVGGVYSTPALATPSLIIKVKYGSTVIATVTTSALLSGATTLEFDGEVDITCRSVGSSGTVMVHGDIEYATGVAGTISVDPLNNAGATTTINTTTANLLDVTVQWDTATSTRIAKSTITTVEVIN